MPTVRGVWSALRRPCSSRPARPPDTGTSDSTGGGECTSGGTSSDGVDPTDDSVVEVQPVCRPGATYTMIAPQMAWIESVLGKDASRAEARIGMQRQRRYGHADRPHCQVPSKLQAKSGNFTAADRRWHNRRAHANVKVSKPQSILKAHIRR